MKTRVSGPLSLWEKVRVKAERACGIMERPYRRNLRAVLHNMLDSFVSRYSSYDGYWLLGFLADQRRMTEIDLLPAPAMIATTPLEVAIQRARRLFQSQLAPQDVKLDEVASAVLKFITHPQEIELNVNGHASAGYLMEFTAIAVSTKNRVFQVSRTIKVARHNPEAETRSG